MPREIPERLSVTRKWVLGCVDVDVEVEGGAEEARAATVREAVVPL